MDQAAAEQTGLEAVAITPDTESGDAQASRPAREPTGDAAVDRALGELDALGDQPLDRHIEVGEQVHRILQGRLADIGRE